VYISDRTSKYSNLRNFWQKIYFIGNIYILRMYIKTHRKLPHPIQTRTRLGFKQACDLHVMTFYKYKDIAFFHNRTELRQAALYERNSEVTFFCPQPRGVKIGKAIYTPDFFYSEGGRDIYVELKPGGKMDKKKEQTFREIAHENACEFIVVSNEDVYKQKVEADNWLLIVRTLVSGKLIDTEGIEPKVLNEIAMTEGCLLSTLLHPKDRIKNAQKELALFRLAHQGVIELDDSKPMGFNTRVDLRF
jgi:hypothetical protein